MKEITDKNKKELALIEYACNLVAASKVASVFGIEESDSLYNVLGDFKHEWDAVGLDEDDSYKEQVEQLLSNVLGEFKRELDAVEVDEDGSSKEQVEQLDAIVTKYVRILNFPLTETWRQITFAHKYEVSNFGRIRNIKTKKVLKPIEHLTNKTKNQLTIFLCCGLYGREEHTISQIVFNHFCLAPWEEPTYYGYNGFKVKNNRIGHYDGNPYNNAAFNLFRY